MARPFIKQRISRAERAFLSAALDPNPDALATWQERSGAPKAPHTGARGKDSNWSRGMALERLAAKQLRTEGYTVGKSQDSAGAADLFARRADSSVDGPPCRDVQVKGLTTFVPSGLNQAVARYLGLGRWRRPHVLADGPRESWLYVVDAGWVARAILHPDDALTVTGPKRREVEQALRKMLAGGGPTQRKTSGKNLRERLEG